MTKKVPGVQRYPPDTSWLDVGTGAARNAERKRRRHRESRAANSGFHRYGTALAYENGEVDFSDDIYGHDAELPRRLPRVIPTLKPVPNYRRRTRPTST
jgi:hypothetical protein